MSVDTKVGLPSVQVFALIRCVGPSAFKHASPVIYRQSINMQS